MIMSNRVISLRWRRRKKCRKRRTNWKSS